MAFVTAGVLILGTAYASHCRKVHRQRKYRDLVRQLTEPRQILSCLIDQVYALSRKPADPFPSEIWKLLGYDREEIDKNYQYQERKPRRVRLMVFRRRLDADEARRPWKYVVAIRGTKVTSFSDIWNDFRVVFESLHKSPRYKKILQLIEGLIDKYGKENVCVAGHSLGAALGLLATRKLALKGKFVETHLFNPPFFSFENLCEKGWKVLKMLITTMSPNLEWQLDAATSAVDSLATAKILEFAAESCEAIRKEFSGLQRWRPYLFLNPGDEICKRYCTHFEKPPLSIDDPHSIRRASSAPALLTNAGFNQVMKNCAAETVSKSLQYFSFHLIPSAKLVINHFGEGCHKLKQWYHKHRIQNLREMDCSLLLEPENDEGSQPPQHSQFQAPTRTQSAHPTSGSMYPRGQKSESSNSDSWDYSNLDTSESDFDGSSSDVEEDY